MDSTQSQAAAFEAQTLRLAGFVRVDEFWGGIAASAIAAPGQAGLRTSGRRMRYVFILHEIHFVKLALAGIPARAASAALQEVGPQD